MRHPRKETSGEIEHPASQSGQEGPSQFSGGLAVVELEVLLLAGCVDLGHGPTGMSVSSHKSLREIADPKEQGSAPASGHKPFERDAVYRAVTRTETSVTVQV